MRYTGGTNTNALQAAGAQREEASLFPQTRHNHGHNTMGTHFTLFEMPLGP